MSDTRTIVIPSMVLNYEDNMLESVGIGGELYYRKQRDWHAIARSHEQTIERMGTENEKLWELVLGLKWCCENYGCKDLCPLYDKSEQDHCREERLMRELGVVDE